MKALVLFHGWGADGRIWQRQVEAFQEHIQVLAPTLPSWDSELVRDFLRRLPLSETLLVGWSLGGMLLLEALGMIGQAPGSLLLTGSCASFCQRSDYPWGQPAGMVRAMRRALKDNPRKVLEEFAVNCLGSEEQDYHAEVSSIFTSPAHPESLAEGLDYLLDRDLRPLLSRGPAGAVVIQGDRDRIVMPDQARYLEENLPESRLVLMKGAGHVPFITQAEAFNEIVLDILRGRLGEHSSLTLPSNSPRSPL